MVRTPAEEWTAIAGLIKRGDTLFIDHIEVREDHARQGWASYMLGELFESHPEIEDIDLLVETRGEARKGARDLYLCGMGSWGASSQTR